MSATPLRIGGQRAWAHDEGHSAGFFHTYDALDVGTRFGPRKVHVLVPRSAPPAGGFASLYLHDGDTAFWPGGVAGQTWDVAGVLSAMPHRPTVVVAVHPVDRNREYTHVAWAGGRSYGALGEHADYLADEIRGFVAAHYPVTAEPRRTAVAGSSHGGLAAFWTATRRPDRFGMAGCLSPSFFTGLDELRPNGTGPSALADSALIRGASEVLADPARRPRLWMCWGLRRDGGEHNAVVEHLATRRGREMRDLLATRFGYATARWPSVAELTWDEEAQHGHDERAWRARFPRFVHAFAVD
jgi:hypothetical protein